MVCPETELPDSSKSHWQRSMIRRRHAVIDRIDY